MVPGEKLHGARRRKNNKVNPHIALSLGVGEETELRRGGESSQHCILRARGEKVSNLGLERFNCTAEGDHTGTGNQLHAS